MFWCGFGGLNPFSGGTWTLTAKKAETFQKDWTSQLGSSPSEECGEDILLPHSGDLGEVQSVFFFWVVAVQRFSSFG